MGSVRVNSRRFMSDISSPLYRDRDLYFFVSSRFIATLAIQVQSVAIGWQVYDMERTPLALGLVGLCQFLPMFLLTLPAGDITDRFNQRRVYSLAAGLQALCSALFLALSIFRPHTAWMYFVVLVLFGSARGFAGPSGSSLLPFLVPPERLSKSMAISSSFFTAATISGPALGGFLYALGPVPVYSICIAGFIGAALIVSQLGGRRFTPQATDQTRFERVTEGVKFVRSRPVVLGAISLDLFAVLLGGATALLPVFARDILHVGPVGLGFLRSAPRWALFHGVFLTAAGLTNGGRQDVRGRRGFGAATIVFSRPLVSVSCWRCSCWAPPTWSASISAVR